MERDKEMHNIIIVAIGVIISSVCIIKRIRGSYIILAVMIFSLVFEVIVPIEIYREHNILLILSGIVKAILLSWWFIYIQKGVNK